VDEPVLEFSVEEDPRLMVDEPPVVLLAEEEPPTDTVVLEKLLLVGATVDEAIEELLVVVDVALMDRPVDDGGCLVQSSPAASNAFTKPVTTSPTVPKRGLMAVPTTGTRATSPWSAVTRLSTVRLICAMSRQSASWSAKGRSRRLPTAGTGTAATAVVTSATLASMFGRAPATLRGLLPTPPTTSSALVRALSRPCRPVTSSRIAALLPCAETPLIAATASRKGLKILMLLGSL